MGGYIDGCTTNYFGHRLRSDGRGVVPLARGGVETIFALHSYIIGLLPDGFNLNAEGPISLLLGHGSLIELNRRRQLAAGGGGKERLALLRLG